MAAQKLEKALYGPSIVEVILGVVLGLFAGVAAASIYLVFKPVKAVMKDPGKEAIRGMVYFLPGSMTSTKGRDWQTKQKKFLAGTNVEVVEDELNAWIATLPSSGSGPAKAAKAPSKPGAAPTPAVPEGFIIPATPNFRMANGQMQIGLKCTLNWYGLMQEVQVQATGGFRKEGDEFVFEPQTVFLGSCPLHMLPSASGLFLSALAAKQKIPDELRAAWVKLNNVTLEGSTLKLAAQ